jgi:HAD superfamily hydrolase (TIGR01490 family)
MTSRAAFFDTDETVISAKSMFDFLRFHLRRTTGDDRAFDTAVATIHAEAARGTHRIEINRMYYRLLAGAAHEELLAAGRDWYAEYAARPDAYVGSVLRAIARHRAAGDLVVLVSGSFRACLDPIAREVGADLVLCSEPEVDDLGRLTGVVARPMIGVNKGLAAQETIAARGLDAAACAAYGDHSSDLDLLRAVGTPVVVGSDPVLVREAEQHGWTVLPHDPAPRPARAA